MPEQHILTLKHREYDHWEWWYDAGDLGVYVTFDCPENLPNSGSHYLTYTEALRQFALLTSEVEGWEVQNGDNWYEFIESHSIP